MSPKRPYGLQLIPTQLQSNFPVVTPVTCSCFFSLKLKEMGKSCTVSLYCSKEHNHAALLQSPECQSQQWGGQHRTSQSPPWCLSPAVAMASSAKGTQPQNNEEPRQTQEEMLLVCPSPFFFFARRRILNLARTPKMSKL